MNAKPTIDIPRVDHIGIRVRDLERALKFYAMLGFTLHAKAANDAVAIIRTKGEALRAETCIQKQVSRAGKLRWCATRPSTKR